MITTPTQSTHILVAPHWTGFAIRFPSCRRAQRIQDFRLPGQHLRIIAAVTHRPLGDGQLFLLAQQVRLAAKYISPVEKGGIYSAVAAPAALSPRYRRRRQIYIPPAYRQRVQVRFHLPIERDYVVALQVYFLGQAG